jgi:hypothetical protein
LGTSPSIPLVEYENLKKLEGTQRLHTSARYSEVKRNLGIS